MLPSIGVKGSLDLRHHSLDIMIFIQLPNYRNKAGAVTSTFCYKEGMGYITLVNLM